MLIHLFNIIASKRRSVTPWWLSGGIASGDCVAAYAPKGAASLADSYINLANPGTYDAVPDVAPTWDTTTGWTFNGFSQNLVTGYNGQGTGSVIISVADLSGYGSICGNQSSAYLFICRHPSVGIQYANADGASSYVGPGAGTDTNVFAMAGRKCYRGGVDEGITLGAYATDMSGAGIRLGCRGRGGDSPIEFIAGKILAASFYSVTLTPEQVASVTASIPKA